MAIYISENGFIVLTLSAIETSIKYEASGILLGYEVRIKDKIIYYVENVIPYQIVVAIELNNKRSIWGYKNKVLSGSIDKYLIKIAGWRVENEKIVEQIIRCPFAVGFDYSKPF